MAKRRKSGRRRRRGSFGFLYKLLSMLIISATIVVAITLFFKVNTIYVSGNQRYTSQQVQDATEIQIGNNLYLLDKNEVAEKYIEASRDSIAEMYRQKGAPNFDENGMLKSGVVVRILLLPGHLAEAKLSLKYLLDTYGDNIYISLMNQYTPMANMEAPLNRRVTHAEYEELLAYAEKLGLKNGFYQDFGTAEESFIPAFDGTGIDKQY